MNHPDYIVYLKSELEAKNLKIKKLEHDLAELHANHEKIKGSHSRALLKKALYENERLHEKLRKLKKVLNVPIPFRDSDVAENHYEWKSGVVESEVGGSKKMASPSCGSDFTLPSGSADTQSKIDSHTV